jgi:hypothetical protein
MTVAAFLQVAFLALAVIGVTLWADRPAHRKHRRRHHCSVCARRSPR